MRIFLALIAISLLIPASSHAAPFCVSKQGVPPECYYVDANECRKRAREINGECAANPKQLTLKRGMGDFCLVDSNKTTMCDYTDRTTCETRAKTGGGVCIESPKTTREKPTPAEKTTKEPEIEEDFLDDSDQTPPDIN